MSGLLAGKVVIVTGAGGGIGRAEALAFSAEGARVVVNDVGGSREGEGASEAAADAVVKEIRDAGGEAVASYGNVADRVSAEALVKTAVDTFGRVDVLVNNAGILRDKTFLKTDEEQWRAVLAVHLDGTFFVSQAAARQMVAQGDGGKIVNTTSVSGMLGNFGQANYAAAKAGVYGLSRTMGIELQKHRITVNAIAPIAKTRLTEDLSMFQGVSTLSPEHVAPVAVFLGSALSGDKTGFVIAVAGSRVYAFKVIETNGKFKEGGAPWTPSELADNWDAIVSTKG